MYAIIRTGGKQYRVQPGDVLKVEKLESDLGSELVLTDVLTVGGAKDGGAVVGTPTVKDAKVTVVITKQTKDRKVIIFKKKRRQGYRRFKTHRQPYTEIFVKSISLAGNTATTDATANVVDVDQNRLDRIQAKVDAKEQRRQAQASGEAAPKTTKKAAAAPKAKKTVKKSAKGGKKSAAKKTTKKA